MCIRVTPYLGRMKSNLLPTYCTGQMLTDIFTCHRIYGYCHLTAQCFELLNINIHKNIYHSIHALDLYCKNNKY